MDVQAFKTLTKTMAGLFLMAAATMSAVAQTNALYATDGNACTSSTLYELNPADGSIISTIGSTGVSGMTALASHPSTGVMYGITTGGGGCTNSLYTVDLASGAATLVGSLGVAGGKPDAAFRSDGVLFTYSTADYFLYTVDLATGAASPVGDTGVSAWDISLTFDGATLVMTDGATVYTVNTSTGLATSGPGLGLSVDDSNMSTTDLQTGQVYLGDRDGSSQGFLYTLDSTTGNMVLLGTNTIGRMSAIEFAADGGSPTPVDTTPVPTMSTYGLVLTMLGLLLVAGRRLRASARRS